MFVLIQNLINNFETWQYLFDSIPKIYQKFETFS